MPSNRLPEFINRAPEEYRASDYEPSLMHMYVPWHGEHRFMSLGNGDLNDKTKAWFSEDGREMYGRSGTHGGTMVPNIRPHAPTAHDARSTPLSSYHHLQQQSLPPTSAHLQSFDTSSSLNTRSTLWWGDLEPWMDEEYAKQVCLLMGWDNKSSNGDGGVTVKIPQFPPDAATGNNANNPGYCFLTFPNSQQAANVLAKLSSNEKTPTMPNSTRPFNLNWASALPPAPVAPIAPVVANDTARPASAPVREHSIFVGDLAPEASNSDLLAVFRNPILGLRSDRAPKCVKPFLSCKSAKIMLDPVTGVSKGYGFVRFTDQAEQQRALMEMHGLYCLSRPMRVSPATAKYKPASPQMSSSLPPSNSYTSSLPSLSSSDSQSINQSFETTAPGNKSVSTPLANEDGTPTAAQNPELFLLSQLAASQSTGNSIVPDDNGWNSPANAQARAILASLTGPNGEQLSSADPYNTTVFVGGLSPLISEDTLRTFFAPFGDIHYVKVPVGKHCGFVQFVRKADAQRAIDRMQGFPIGGSRIRLSWGRSQYKAAQAVVQQAQLSMQQTAPPPPPTNPSAKAQLTQQQAFELLHKLGYADTGGAQNDLSGNLISLNSQGINASHDSERQKRMIDASTRARELAQMANKSNAFSRMSFSPFEHHHSRSDGTNKESHFFASTPNPAPTFGPSSSVPADMKINPVPYQGRGGNVSPQSSVYSSDATVYNGRFDGLSTRGPYFGVSNILRMDSQPVPRSSSNFSSQMSETEVVSPSHSSFASVTDVGEGFEGEIQDLNGTLKSLDLGGGAANSKVLGDTLAPTRNLEDSKRSSISNGVSSPRGSIGKA